MIKEIKKIKSYTIWKENDNDSYTIWPKEGEEFWGIPTDYYNINSSEYIEIRREELITHTVNTQKIDEIEFFIND